MVVRVLVDGLKVKPVPKLNGWLLLEEEAKKAGKKEALVEVETVAPLVALVAVVAVVAFPVNAPMKVVAVKALVDGLTVMPAVVFHRLVPCCSIREGQEVRSISHVIS